MGIAVVFDMSAYRTRKGDEMKKVDVLTINTMPEIDPYHSDTGKVAAISFWLDPQKRWCRIDSDYDTGGMAMSVYLNRQYNIRLNQSPDQDKAREYLESESGQRWLRDICDGHSVEWDGHNMVGYLTQEAETALDILIEDLNGLPESEWELWDVDDWLNQSDIEITADTTDEEIAALAKQIEADAKAVKGVLPNVTRFLRQEREWLQ